MTWDRSEAMALAQVGCSRCMGIGLLPGYDRKGHSPCGCVLRRIFNACLDRYRQCSESINPFRQSGSNRYLAEEYCADFTLIARRILTPGQYRLFLDHCILGHEYGYCCAKYHLEPAAFWRQLYRLQEQLGRAYRELEPHALFPLNHYFSGTLRKRAAHVAAS